MKTFLRSVDKKNSVVTLCFFRALLITLLLPITASAIDQENVTDKSAQQLSELKSTGRWTVSAGAIILQRVGAVNQILVERVPGVTPFPFKAPWVNWNIHFSRAALYASF